MDASPGHDAATDRRKDAGPDVGYDDCLDAASPTEDDAGPPEPRVCLTHAENVAPPPPLPLSPVSGECICQERTLLLVGNSGDADGDPLRYHFEVGADPTFADAQRTPPEGIPPGSSAGVTQWIAPSPLPSGPLYWRTWVDDCFEDSDHIVSIFRSCD